MKVHILTAEHFSVPGIITKAFADLAGAEAEAMDLTNLMLADNGQAKSANASNWRAKVEALQDEHGAEHCYVDIVEIPVRGSNEGGQLAADLILLERLTGTRDPRGLQDMRAIIARAQRDTASLADAARRAEAFIAGFEDDESQEVIPDLLASIRAAIAGTPADPARAAAPDVLAALKVCALEIAQIHNRKLTIGEQIALDAARAAIAKAEGRANG